MNELINQQREQIAQLTAERDALAATVAGINDEISDFLAALDGMLMADLSSEEIAYDLEKRLSNYDLSQQHLAEIRAQVGYDGYLQALKDVDHRIDTWCATTEEQDEQAANQYADSIRNNYSIQRQEKK